MQDDLDSMETTEPEGKGQGDGADAPEASTVLAEVLPGVAVVFGEIPAELKLDLIDFGLVPAGDRTQISTFLASIGNTATVAGNLGSAFAGLQGIYRLSDATMAALKAGGTLAVKDGANLGAVFAGGKIVHQARFIPVTAVSAAQTVAALGPALAMVALQMQLSEITGLARTNIAVTSQVLTTIRHRQWSELTALVATIDDIIDQARELDSLPASLWETVAGKKADLRTQLDLYRLNVGAHIRQIQQLGTRARREYLETNAEAILFDANALLTSLKAWTGYQALHAARARATGPEESALVDSIARRTREELESALPETTSLVDSLTRELRIIVELPGRDSRSLPGMRKDSNAARQASARLLAAIEPLADVLHPPAPPLEAPGVVCAPGSLTLERHLRILRWFLEDGESLRVLGAAEPLDAADTVSAIFSGAKEMLGSAKDKTLVAVTNRRIIITRMNVFLEQGEIRQDIPIDQVRYVRVATTQDKSPRPAIDLITRDENIRWVFSTDTDDAQVFSLAAVLAESMGIPEAEREELERRRQVPAKGPLEPAESDATSGVAG